MVCRNCGSEMRDDARFCPHCGAVNGPDSGLSQSPAPWEAPSGGKRNIGRFLGIGAALVAVIALVAVFASGALGSAKGQVEKAFAQSAAAYQAAEEALGLPDMAQIQRDQAMSQDMVLELTGINSNLVGYDLSALNGLGLSMNAGYSGQDRLFSFDLGAYWGEDDLLSFGMAADDAELYFALPQFLGSEFYGMNTETLGVDLAALTGDDTVPEISFNLFDLMDIAMEHSDPETMEQAVQKANKALLNAMEVKKTGSKTLDLNGTSTKTTAYHAVIPQEALDQYVDAVASRLSPLNYYSFYEEIYQAMGLTQTQVDELLSDLEDLETGALHDALDDIGDLEVDICLSDGYVSAILYEGQINGSDIAVSIYLGGGEEYVDDLSAVIEVDGGVIELASSGDHGLKSGVYTDTTTLRIRDGSSGVVRLTSEATLDPSKRGSNFQWKLGLDSSGLSLFVLETAGSVAMDPGSLSLELGDISVRTMGMEVCTLRLAYHLANRGPDRIDVGSPRMIASLSEQELLQLEADVENNAARWLAEMQQLFTTRLPDDVLWAILGGY